MRERLALVDVLKGICIALIVIGHAKSVSTLHEFIGFLFLFHVPIFFFISGLTLNTDTHYAKSFDRVISISLTYLSLSFLALPKLVFINHSFDFIAYARGVLYGTGHTIIVTPIWFLTCLSLSLLIATLILNAIRSKWILALTALLILWGGAYFLSRQHYLFDDRIGWGNIRNSGYIWNFDIAIIGSGFVLLGSLLKHNLSQANDFIRQLINFILLVSITIFLYAHYLINVDLNFRVFEPWSLAVFSALTGIGSVVFFAGIVIRNNFLSKILITIGQSSLIILFLHRDIQIVITKILTKLLPNNANDLNFYTICGLFVLPIVISILVDLFVIRRFKLLSTIIYPRPKVFQR